MQINLSDFLTSGAILVALVTWWATFRQQRISDRAARTAEVIANLSISDKLAEAAYQLTRLLNAGEKVSYDTIDESTERHVVSILDYYEYLCELYESGVLSKTTIVNVRGQLMAYTYKM